MVKVPKKLKRGRVIPSVAEQVAERIMAAKPSVPRKAEEIPKHAYDETVLIKLEDDKEKVFTVYKYFLKECPGYFSTALESQFREANNNEFVLEDTDADTIRLFIHWMMYKTILEAKTARAIQFCKLWVFADVRGIDQLKIDVTQAFIDRMEDRYLRWKCWKEGVAGMNELMYATRADVLNYVWDRTPAESPLRRLLVDQYFACPHELPEADQEKWPTEYLVAIINQKSKRMTTDSEKVKMHLADYFEEDDEGSERKMKRPKLEDSGPSESS